MNYQIEQGDLVVTPEGIAGKIVHLVRDGISVHVDDGSYGDPEHVLAKECVKLNAPIRVRVDEPKDVKYLADVAEANSFVNAIKKGIYSNDCNVIGFEPRGSVKRKYWAKERKPHLDFRSDFQQIMGWLEYHGESEDDECETCEGKGWYRGDVTRVWCSDCLGTGVEQDDCYSDEEEGKQEKFTNEVRESVNKEIEANQANHAEVEQVPDDDPQIKESDDTSELRPEDEEWHVFRIERQQNMWGGYLIYGDWDEPKTAERLTINGTKIGFDEGELEVNDFNFVEEDGLFEMWVRDKDTESELESVRERCNHYGIRAEEFQRRIEEAREKLREDARTIYGGEMIGIFKELDEILTPNTDEGDGCGG